MSEGDPSPNVPPIDLPRCVPNSPPQVNQIADQAQRSDCLTLWRNLHQLRYAIEIRLWFIRLLNRHQRAADALQQRIAELFPELADFNQTLDALESLRSGEIQNQGSITAFLGHLEAAVCNRVEQIDALGHHFTPQDPDILIPFAVIVRPLGQGSPSLWNPDQRIVSFDEGGCDLDFDAWERDAAAAFASADPQIEQLIDTLKTEPASLRLVTDENPQQCRLRWESSQNKLFLGARLIATWDRHPKRIAAILNAFHENAWSGSIEFEGEEPNLIRDAIANLNRRIEETAGSQPVQFHSAGGDTRVTFVIQ